MKLSTLNQRHSACDLGTFRRYDALYRGGQAFRKLIGEFLHQNPLEPTQAYELRKKEAAYRSYVGPIVDFFAAQLFASPFIVRANLDGEPTTAGHFYGDFKEDVDLNGTDLVAFMKSRFTTSLVKGCSWWLCELPDEGEVPAQSRADWDARGLGRVRLCPLEPDAVLDWECDDYGQLQWAIVYKRETRRDNPRLERQLVTETWRLFEPETVETFQVVYDPKQRQLRPDDEIPSIGVKPHRFPRVPLIQMRLPEGLWLLNRAADAQVAHFRLSAAMSWAAARTCYPMAVFKSADKENPPTTGAGYLQMIGTEESFEWVAPSTASFDVLAAEIKAQATEIYRVSQQMAHSVDATATVMGRSGESKAADNAATEICLHAYAVHVKEAIENTFELISDGRGDVDVHFSIEGMSHFNMDSITQSLANIATAKSLSIPSPTLMKELGMKAADLLLPDADQATKDLIREEIMTLEERKPEPPAVIPPGDEAGDSPVADTEQPTA